MTDNTPEQEQVVHAEVVLDETETQPTAEDLGLDLPENPDEAVNYLLVKLRDSRDEATSYLGDLKRVAADFDNYRRRAMREQAETTEAEEKLLAGIHRTREQILSILGAHGLEVVPALGEVFDPEVHEAVMSPSEGSGRLIVSEELRRGYRLKDRLIRAALVALEYEDNEQ